MAFEDRSRYLEDWIRRHSGCDDYTLLREMANINAGIAEIFEKLSPQTVENKLTPGSKPEYVTNTA